jgi:hypothetical protein
MGFFIRLGFARRIEQHDHGRQHGDGQQECHDHAKARDLSELGHAVIGGRQE